MAKYRKKPVVVDAVKVPLNEYADDPISGWKEYPEWLRDAFANKSICPEFRTEDYWYYLIKTLEEDHLASPGDFVIRGIKGELYPCKADIFAATYEKED